MKKIKIIISLLIIIFWMGMIFFLSSMPGGESHKKSRVVLKKVVETAESSQIDDSNNEITEKERNKNNYKIARKYDALARKLAHACEYLVLDLLVLNFLFIIRKDKKLFFIILSILICFLYACTDEFHQLFVDGRGSSFIDVLIDTSGSLIGGILFLVTYNIYNKVRQFIANNK